MRNCYYKLIFQRFNLLCVSVYAKKGLSRLEREKKDEKILRPWSWKAKTPWWVEICSRTTDLFVPRNIPEALEDQNWKVVVMEEMNALKSK